MNAKVTIWIMAACLSIPVLAAASAPPQVAFENGLLSVSCTEAPLSQVFEQISAVTGMELILEDAIKTRRLTAQIEAQPLHFAIERLLEGSGVNYAMSFHHQNWQQVAKIFIGSGGENPAPSSQAAVQTPTRRRPIRRPTPADAEQPEDMMDEPEPLEEEEPLPEEMEADIPMDDTGEVEPPSSNYLPPPPAYPRSSFTPGLESSPFGQTNRQGQSQQSEASGSEEESPPPPAYYPFLDPFGRPIPVPPGPPQQKKQQEKK